ncbi:MAG: bifunctional hydroxymethylpyrimidine kinase/phosphomethylpyrimidine kinase [Myxococcales bacterium]|nr:bifunctional hydroxymethylpyrimidine kinase/phosphomethylpyrimidine kinase [Myxococcales bacterium]
MRCALSIAGSDPTGGAGLQLDVQVFRLHGVHGAGVPTALTVQDTRSVHSVLPTFPSVMLDQLRVLLADLAFQAIKVGMLASDDVARAVALALEGLRPRPPLVLDPVFAASDGTVLLERRARPILESLIEGCALVTPNLEEAAQLTGEDTSDEAGVRRAAQRLISDFGAGAALVKGGHRDGPSDDLLALRSASGIRCLELPGSRIDAPSLHGTGCALSAAIAARLARGEALEDAIEGARSFLRHAIARAVGRGENEPRLLDFGDASL